MLSRGLFAAVAALLCLGLGAAFQLRSSPVRLAAVVRSGAAGASIQAMSRGVSGETSPSVADSAALLQSSPVHLEAIAKSDAAWKRRELGEGVRHDTDGTVYDHGINDMTGMSRTKYYQTWTSMLQLCYSAKFHEKRPTYKGCSVCPEWLYFSVFHAWMQAHDGYREGLELNKDILVIGNKVYSPQTCLFVSDAVNLLLTDRGAARGELAQGVAFHKPMGKFLAQMSIDGKLKNLGLFDSEDEAEEAYLAAKSDNIRRTIDLLPGDPYHEPTRQGLARHADRFSPRSNEVHVKAMATGIARAAAAEKRKAARGDLPKGVCLHKASGKYRAQISLGGKQIYLGSFATPEEAEEAVRSAKSAPEGIEAYIAARSEKRKAAWSELPKGVYFHKPSEKYRAAIRTDGKTKHLGYFATLEEAEEEYLVAKSAPEGVEAYIAAKVAASEKRKVALGDLPKDVYLHKPSGKYKAQFSIGGKLKHLGSFATPEEAEEAVRSAKSAPEGIEAELAAKAEKRKAARAGFPTGVSLNKASGKYVAMISISGGGKRIHLGLFATPEEAEEAIRSAKSAPEGIEAYIAAKAAASEKRKAARGELPKGVYFHKAREKYEAAIRIDGKSKFLGYFATPEEAEEKVRLAKSAPEGLEADSAARTEKRKAARGDLPTGVYLMARGKYLAAIRIGGKLKHLGYFATPEEAGEVYRTARLKYPAQSPGSTAAVAASIA